MASWLAAPPHTHRDPLSFASDDFGESAESVDLQRRQLLISHKLVEEKLDTDELGDSEAFIVRDAHHEGQRHEHIRADQLWTKKQKGYFSRSTSPTWFTVCRLIGGYFSLLNSPPYVHISQRGVLLLCQGHLTPNILFTHSRLHVQLLI